MVHFHAFLKAACHTDLHGRIHFTKQFYTVCIHMVTAHCLWIFSKYFPKLFYHSLYDPLLILFGVKPEKRLLTAKHLVDPLIGDLTEPHADLIVV